MEPISTISAQWVWSTVGVGDGVGTARHIWKRAGMGAGKRVERAEARRLLDSGITIAVACVRI